MLIIVSFLSLEKGAWMWSTMDDFPRKLLFPSILLPDGNVVFFLPHEGSMSIKNNHISRFRKGGVALRENSLIRGEELNAVGGSLCYK